MAMHVRVPTIDDVETDEDLIHYFNHQRKMMMIYAREYASTAADLSAMLKAHDKRSGVKRRHKVTRPVALAAAVMLLVGRYMALAAKRFRLEYQPEIEAARGRVRRAGNRTMKFGG